MITWDSFQGCNDGTIFTSITAEEIEAVIQKLPTHKSPGADGFTEKFYKAFKEELTPMFHRLFKNIQNDGRVQTCFMKPASS